MPGRCNAPDPVSPAERAAYFGWHWGAADAAKAPTASKANNAEINLKLWNVGSDGPNMEMLCGRVRNCCLKWWAQRLAFEATKWLCNQAYEDLEEKRWDQVAILEVIECSSATRSSTWWEWKDGSCLIFWRWPVA